MREIPGDVRARYVAQGWWSGESVGQMLDSGPARTRDLSYPVLSESRPWAGIIADVELIARRLATGLRSRGVEAGDVVVFARPNRMESAAGFWASSLVGIVAFRACGSTGHPSITGSPFDAPRRCRLLTDGRPKPGVEVRLGDDGEILSRGPDLFMGYTDETLTAAAFDGEGWYRTVDNVRSHFKNCGVVRREWPEQTAELNDFPWIPSGNAQKPLIRRRNLFESQRMR